MKDILSFPLKYRQLKKKGTSKCLGVNASNGCVNREETSSVLLDWLHFERGGGVTYWKEASGENLRWLVSQTSGEEDVQAPFLGAFRPPWRLNLSSIQITERGHNVLLQSGAKLKKSFMVSFFSFFPCLHASISPANLYGNILFKL
jgi:hypothetical protein